jgi:hypothetical protein
VQKGANKCILMSKLQGFWCPFFNFQNRTPERTPEEREFM